MPLARSLVVVGVLMLSGCAQSSRAPGISHSAGSESDSTAALASLEEPEPAARLASGDACAYRDHRGIAQVLSVNHDQVVLRFYPGDEVFTRNVNDPEVVGAKPGDEFKSVRGERTSGHCEALTYLLLEPFDAEDLDLLAQLN